MDNDDVQFPCLYPPKCPSLGTHSILEDALQRAPKESRAVWALRRYILAAAKSTESFGAGSFLFACLDGLVRLYLATSPKSVPIFHNHHAFDEYPGPKYFSDWSRIEGYRSEYIGLGSSNPIIEPRVLWRRLRGELDAQQLALTRLPDFVRLNFALGKGQPEGYFKELERMYKNHTKELEIAEARLRDHIGMLNSQKSTEMAEKSIAESKRVILRRFCFSTLML